MFKKAGRILLSSLVVAVIAAPLLSGAIQSVLAFSGTFTRTQGIIVTDTSGVSRSNVPVSLTGINGNTYKTSAYINLTGTDTATVDNTTGADENFMMQAGTNSGLIIPSLPAYGSVSVNLLMGTSVNQTGFPIITGGYVTTTEAPNLKGSANFSLNASVDLGHSANITRKVGEVILQDSGTGNVTGNVTASGNMTVVQNISDTSWGTIDAPALTRIGQFLGSVNAGTFYSVNLTLRNPGGAAGTANVTLRRVSDDSIIGVLGTIDTASIPFVSTTYSFISPVVNPTKQDLMLLLELPPNSSIRFSATLSDLTYGHLVYYAGVYVDTNTDSTIQYTFATGNASVSAMGISNGIKAVSLLNSNYYLTLSIDGVLKDFIYGVNMSSSVNNWLWLEGVPYADNITYSVNGVQQLYYAPTAMIVGTTLPDRSADATNNDGTITWGANSGLSVAYGSVLDAPAIQTMDASGILSTSAYLAGKLVSLGSNPDVTVGFQWGQDTTYGSGSTPVVQETVATTYFFQLTGLSPSTTYHFRAFVTAGTQTLYGADKSFATQPVAGSSTTILIKSAKMFQDYITSGDYLLTAEVMNNYTNLYPNQSPKEHFTLQLLALDNLTILGASPLTNWGDRPASIYFAPTANITSLSLYFVKMVGDSASNFTSVEYQLQLTDWKGADLTTLDSWSTGTAINMAISDNVPITTYVAYPTNQQAVINDAAGGFFTTGIPDIGVIRPHNFATAQYQTPLVAGTASNAWDKSDADPAGWRAFVGASLASDIDSFALPFGVTGKDFAAAMVVLMMLGCVMFVVGSGGAMALGGVFISVPILWLGVFARAVPIAAIILMIIFFAAFAIRQFVVKTL